MVSPFNLDLLNPASLDVRLGFNVMVEVADQQELVLMDIADRSKDDPYWL